MERDTKKILVPKFSTLAPQDKILFVIAILDIIVTLGGVLLGIATGTRNPTNNGTIPNPHIIPFGTAGFALAGMILIFKSWKQKNWNIMVTGGVMIALGIGATINCISHTN